MEINITFQRVLFAIGLVVYIIYVTMFAISQWNYNKEITKKCTCGAANTSETLAGKVIQESTGKNMANLNKAAEASRNSVSKNNLNVSMPTDNLPEPVFSD